MLVAQLVIVGAVVIGAFAGTVFAIFGVRRDDATPAMQQVGSTILEAFEAYLGRTYLSAFAAAIVLALVAGGVVGGWERSLEDGMLAGGALMVGALAAAIPGIAGTMLIARGARAAAGAAQSGPRAASRVALRIAGAGALLSGALVLGGVAGTFAAYSALLDKPVEDAPQLMAAFALGAAIVAIFARLSGELLGESAVHAVDELATPPESIPTNDPRNPGVSAAMVGRAARAAGAISDGSDNMALVSVSALVIGATAYHVTGEMEWLLLPLAMLGAGLGASLLGLLAGGVSAGGRVSLLGPLVAVVASLLGAVALCFALIEEEWWWFAGAASAGIAAGFAALLVHRSVSGRTMGASGIAHARAGAATLLVIGAALLGAHALGEQGATRAIAPSGAGQYGLLLAATGLLMPAAYFAALAAARPILDGAQAMAEIAFDAAPETLPATRAAQHGLQAPATGVAGFGASAALVAIIVAILAMLQLARLELGGIAADSPGRYADLTQDLGTAPAGTDLNPAIANAVNQYGQLLRIVEVAVGDDDAFGERTIERLAAADRAETDGYRDRLLDDEGVAFDDIRDVEASPYPLPRVLPVSLSRADVLAGVLAGLALATLIFGRLTAAGPRLASAIANEIRRQFIETAGIRTGEVRADYARAGDAGTGAAVRAMAIPLVGIVVLPSLAGVGLRYAFGGEGNEGWLAATGLLVAFGLLSTLAALWTLAMSERHPVVQTVTESFSEAATSEGLVVAAEVSVTNYEDGRPVASSFEAAVGAVLPALARLAVAAAMVAVPVLVG